MGVKYWGNNLCSISSYVLTLTELYFGIHERGEIRLEGEITSLIYDRN